MQLLPFVPKVDGTIHIVKVFKVPQTGKKIVFRYFAISAERFFYSLRALLRLKFLALNPRGDEILKACWEGIARRMSTHRSVSRVNCYLLVVALLTTSLFAAQESSGTGNLSGSITGPRGASISGAAISLTNRITGFSSSTVSSPAGTYAIRDLPPGDYVLHVAAKGF